MKPIIGITANSNKNQYLLNKAYCNAIIAAGGIPVILPHLETAATLEDIATTLDLLDGLLLSGGGDIDAAFFHQPLDDRCDGVDQKRDAYELALCKMAIDRDMAMLCICRGLQVLCVATGGTLNQHINHHSYPTQRTEEVHPVHIAATSQLFSIVQREKLLVNSVHHQAVDTLGGALLVTATAPDGTIEGVEMPCKTFVQGVQWHPEALFHLFPLHLQLFVSLVEHAVLPKV